MSLPRDKNSSMNSMWPVEREGEREGRRDGKKLEKYQLK